ncbi:MAG: hypothetical protein M1831_002542 [Alyxoria varia]|nr:MAG: hypothetical protein M1831_002542 [Alyxoria varia]
MLFSLLVLLLASTCNGRLFSDSFGVPGNATFDYVVVGGGTAGLAIAARLAEDSANSVAVIEAGGFYEVDNGNWSVIPGYCTRGISTVPGRSLPLVDWSFNTVPQAGIAGRRLHYARGKTLGGSSARHYMAYHRPTRGSMEQWADEVGDAGYEFDNMLPHFKAGIAYSLPDLSTYTNSTLSTRPLDFDEDSSGPLYVSYHKVAGAFASWAQRAFNAQGMRNIQGLNSGSLLGSAYATYTIDQYTAQRSSSESSYLRSAIENTPLQVYQRTLAQKILFDRRKVAKGVDVSTGGLDYTISARKEVIVSAGAFQSPQLLMVSGIGPAEVLNQFSIPIIHESPGVGQNLRDQASFGTSFRVNVTTASTSLNNPEAAASANQLYRSAASGPLSVCGSSYLGWEKLPDDLRSTLSSSTLRALDTFAEDWPEIEFLPSAAFVQQMMSDPVDGYNYATLLTALVAPLSRGNITINSNKMSGAPIINPDWLSHPADVDLAVAAVKRQRQIWATLASYNFTIGEEYYPGQNVKTDEQILRWVQETASTTWHASATCKMGKKEDRMAVIDNKTRVFGVKGLRVVDASSFPFLPPGHPQSIIYALAEKTASDIRGEDASLRTTP